MAVPSNPTDDPKASATDPAVPELPKPQRYLTEAEAVKFLGLRSRSSLTYLHKQPDGPPFVRLTSRKKVYSLTDLMAWAESRKAS